MKNKIIELYQKIYNNQPEKVYFSPGRVNIIGGHTDYNGGAVLPFCINMGIYGAVSYRNDNLVRIYSENISRSGIISFHLNELAYDEARGFANYTSGVILKLKENGYSINRGFDIVVWGNLPRGGGLSSSAAFSILMATIINDMEGFALDGINMAVICRQVENDYIGVNCGIMDQFIIANAMKDHALYLEANSLYYEQVPCIMDEYKFVLINSNITRKLVESNYNQRQKETQDLLQILKEHVDIEYICELSPDDYSKYENKISSDVLKKRFKHLVNEHHRVKLSKTALLQRDFKMLGRLLNEAHQSAKDLYEISGDVLDQLVLLARQSGSTGSKMIGGGFGGSTLNLVKSDNLDLFIETFTSEYKRIYNREPIIHIVAMEDGVREI